MVDVTGSSVWVGSAGDEAGRGVAGAEVGNAGSGAAEAEVGIKGGSVWVGSADGAGSIPIWTVLHADKT